MACIRPTLLGVQGAKERLRWGTGPEAFNVEELLIPSTPMILAAPWLIATEDRSLDSLANLIKARLSRQVRH